MGQKRVEHAPALDPLAFHVINLPNKLRELSLFGTKIFFYYEETLTEDLLCNLRENMFHRG